MIFWRQGTVVDIAEERDGVQEIEVAADDGGRRSAIHYTDVLPKLRIGDCVIVNVTAEELRLGGAKSIVHEVLRPPDQADSAPAHSENRLGRGGSRGHIVKLRYTPLQRAVLAAEEEASPHHSMFAERRSLDGMPVLIGELHSMLPIAAVWIRAEETARRTAYVMTDGAALPLAFSRHAARLRRGGWLCGTVTYGHAYGGELEAINKYTALLAARHALKADLAIAVMGPGIVGTGTPLGHTATETAELIHAVHALGGIPVVMPRISFADRRERHYGVSHHLLETLGSLALTRAILPLPADMSEPKTNMIRQQLEQSGCAARHDIVWVEDVRLEEVERRLSDYTDPITTMGRGLSDDPAFYLAVCAAARHASRLVPRPE